MKDAGFGRRHGVSRRRLLQGIGAAAVGLPFLRLAPSAEAAGLPKRLVVWFTPNSAMHHTLWTPGSGFVLPEIFAPLTPYRDRILFLDGLDNRLGIDDIKGGHNCMGPMLTGARNYYPNPSATHVFTSEGPSIDQAVAQHLGVDPLTLGVRVGNSSGTYRMSYSAPRSPVTPIEDPVRAFERAFGAAPSPGDESGDVRAAQRRSVLDAAALQLARLEPQVPRADRYRLERHLDELRSLERRLDRPAISCEPTPPGSVDPDADSRFPQTIDDQIDVAVQALRCGVTRVVGIQIGSTGAAGTPLAWGLDVTTGDGEHDVAHAYRYGRDDAAAEANRKKVEVFYSQKLARLLESLGPDLDDTLVFWVKSIGHNHSEENIPAMLIGGESDGSYRTGRHLHYEGRNHNDLLTAVGQIMGMPITEFGDAGYNAGALDLA